MPTYPYRCPFCDHKWDDDTKIENRLDGCCPDCGNPGIEIDFSRLNQEVSCYDHYDKGIMVDDHSQKPKDAKVFHSKKEHKEWLKRNNLECPGFM